MSLHLAFSPGHEAMTVITQAGIMLFRIQCIKLHPHNVFTSIFYSQIVLSRSVYVCIKVVSNKGRTGRFLEISPSSMSTCYLLILKK